MLNKKNKKVLLISPFFYPEKISTGKYNTILSESLRERGFRTKVLCSYPIYPKWKVQISNEELPGIDIQRNGRWVKYPKSSLLRRFVLEFWFTVNILLKTFLVFRYENIICVIPPSLFCLFVCILAKKSRLICIIHDLQGVHITTSNSISKKLIARLIKSIEATIFRKSRHLIFLSSEMKDVVNAEFADLELKSSVIYPPITVDTFNNNRDLDFIFNKRYVNIVYSGALGDKQSPELLIELAQLIISKSNFFRFIFVSNGPIFEAMKIQNSNPDIMFINLVDEIYLGELLVRSDLQIVPQRTNTSKGSLPSKIPNILKSGTSLYVITDRDSELDKLVSEHDGCVVSNTWDIQQNYIQIMDFYKNTKFKKKNRNDCLSKFDEKRLSELVSCQFE